MSSLGVLRWNPTPIKYERSASVKRENSAQSLDDPIDVEAVDGVVGEQAYAEACGNTELLASVETARQRLIEYIDTDDPAPTSER